MSPRRQQTSYESEQPVRFYKIIAIGFLLIAMGVLTIVGFLSTKKAIITIETKAEPIDGSGIVTVGNGETAGAWNGIVTSTLVSYSGYASPSGGREVDAIAIGVVTLHNETSSSQTLVPTTRLLTDNGILFRMKNSATIPAEGSIDVSVYADKAGVGGNIGPSRFSIPGLNAEKQKVIYATSDKDMTGGTKRVGVFSDDDQKNAEQMVRDQLLEQGKKILAPIVGDLGTVYTLSGWNIKIEDVSGTSTDQVAVSGTGDVTVVAFPKDAVSKYVSDVLSKRAIDDTEIIEANHDEPAVSVESVDKINQTAKVKITSGGVAALNPESQQLQKSLFFGKSKDEVRRYVLSLDHVHGVDIEFKPAWVLTVPSVADHVSIVVKRIE